MYVLVLYKFRAKVQKKMHIRKWSGKYVPKKIDLIYLIRHSILAQALLKAECWDGEWLRYNRFFFTHIALCVAAAFTGRIALLHELDCRDQSLIPSPL